MSVLKSLNYTLGVLRRYSFLTKKSYFKTNHGKLFRNLEVLSTYEIQDSLSKRNASLQASEVFSDNTCSLFESVEKIPFNQREDFMRKTWLELVDKSNDQNLLIKYLKLCLDNEITINFKEIVASNDKISKEVFILMLECVCEKGDIKQAIDILAAMKLKNIPADEVVFNTLILGQVVADGLEGANSILATMKSAQVPVSFDTHWAIIKGLSKRETRQEFIDCLNKAPRLLFDEKKFFDVLLMLGLNNNQLWVKELMTFFGLPAIPRQTLISLDNLCLYLVRRGKPEAAIHFYNTLAENYHRGNYGEDLLKEMLHFNTPFEKIINICSNLKSKNLNDQVFFYVTEQTLKQGLVRESLQLFEHLDYLRSHYFWPLIILRGESEREKGVMEILTKMKEMNVKPDFETFAFYFFKYCDTNNVFELIDRIREVYDLTLKDLITPCVAYLLSIRHIRDAVKLCEKFEVEIIGERIITPLASVWKGDASNVNCVKILQKICETNSITTDWTGLFLLKTLKFCETDFHFDKYLQLINEIHNKKLTISPLYNDFTTNYLKYKSKDCKIKFEIEEKLDLLLDTSKVDTTNIKHPRNMVLSDLECQLIEQLNKNMEVRGVIRLLVQEYTKTGNFESLVKMRKLFSEKNYKESAGMKSNFFHCYTLMGKLEEAKEVFDDLKFDFPEFTLDTYKILDYATLLVKNNCFDQAIDVLKYSNINIRNRKSILHNCLSLLTSTQEPEQVDILFKMLVDLGFCDVTNVTLGPLIRVHLNRGDYKAAAKKFCDITNEHKYTPLQLELLMKLLEEKDDNLLQEVLNAIGSVHGELSAKMSFIFALAEKGFDKPLEKFFIEIKRINKDALHKRCLRWASEEKLLPIMTIIKASSRLNCDIGLSNVYLAAMKVFSLRNDSEGALILWKNAEDKEVYIKEMKIELLNLLSRCNHKDLEFIRNKV